MKTENLLHKHKIYKLFVELATLKMKIWHFFKTSTFLAYVVSLRKCSNKMSAIKKYINTQQSLKYIIFYIRDRFRQFICECTKIINKIKCFFSQKSKPYDMWEIVVEFHHIFWFMCVHTFRICCGVCDFLERFQVHWDCLNSRSKKWNKNIQKY